MYRISLRRVIFLYRIITIHFLQSLVPEHRLYGSYAVHFGIKRMNFSQNILRLIMCQS